MFIFEEIKIENQEQNTALENKLFTLIKGSIEVINGFHLQKEVFYAVSVLNSLQKLNEINPLTTGEIKYRGKEKVAQSNLTQSNLNRIEAAKFLVGMVNEDGTTRKRLENLINRSFPETDSNRPAKQQALLNIAAEFEPIQRFAHLKADELAAVAEMIEIVINIIKANLAKLDNDSVKKEINRINDSLIAARLSIAKCMQLHIQVYEKTQQSQPPVKAEESSSTNNSGNVLIDSNMGFAHLKTSNIHSNNNDILSHFGDEIGELYKLKKEPDGTLVKIFNLGQLDVTIESPIPTHPLKESNALNPVSTLTYFKSYIATYQSEESNNNQVGFVANYNLSNYINFNNFYTESVTRFYNLLSTTETTINLSYNTMQSAMYQSLYPIWQRHLEGTVTGTVLKVSWHLTAEFTECIASMLLIEADRFKHTVVNEIRELVEQANEIGLYYTGRQKPTTEQIISNYRQFIEELILQRIHEREEKIGNVPGTTIPFYRDMEMFRKTHPLPPVVQHGGRNEVDLSSTNTGISDASRTNEINPQPPGHSNLESSWMDVRANAKVNVEVEDEKKLPSEEIKQSNEVEPSSINTGPSDFPGTNEINPPPPGHNNLENSWITVEADTKVNVKVGKIDTGAQLNIKVDVEKKLPSKEIQQSKVYSILYLTKHSQPSLFNSRSHSTNLIKAFLENETVKDETKQLLLYFYIKNIRDPYSSLKRELKDELIKSVRTNTNIHSSIFKIQSSRYPFCLERVKVDQKYLKSVSTEDIKNLISDIDKIETSLAYKASYTFNLSGKQTHYQAAIKKNFNAIIEKLEASSPADSLQLRN